MVATAEAKFAAPKIRQTNMLINGKWVESRSGKRFKTINPVNETVIAEVAEGDPADVDEHVGLTNFRSSKFGFSSRDHD